MWGIALGLSIFFICPENAFLAGQEPVMRVLVKDSIKFRLRADGSIPLRVRGLSYREKKVDSLNLKIKNDQFLWSEASGEWNSLPQYTKLIIRSSDPRGIWLGKRRYRGELRVGMQGQRLIVVNHLGIERYLMSVVGSEMPKSWPKAALRAQAVAARTYALKKLRKDGFYDINSTESSQVYLGIESETASTRKAVNSTRSLVVLHKGKLISAVFHSSSGGQTEASGEVWKYQLPYLISVRDYDQHSPKYHWKMMFSSQELNKIFSETGGIQNIKILKTSETGRILLSKINGPKGSLLLSGKELRKRMKLKSTKARFQFFIDKKNYKHLNQPPQTPNNFESPPALPKLPKLYVLSVKGFGSGHGVGMSQWGAHGMATKGFNFRQIISHYYSGVKIKPY